jgi:hypothetical protein
VKDTPRCYFSCWPTLSSRPTALQGPRGEEGDKDAGGVCCEAAAVLQGLHPRSSCKRNEEVASTAIAFLNSVRFRPMR